MSKSNWADKLLPPPPQASPVPQAQDRRVRDFRRESDKVPAHVLSTRAQLEILDAANSVEAIATLALKHNRPNLAAELIAQAERIRTALFSAE